MSEPPSPIVADLAGQGFDPSRMGLAYARRAYPLLDDLSAEDAYSRGLCDGAMAVMGMMEGFVTDAIDAREMLTRMFDPDILPMPKVDE